jgi:cobalt/nickel transport system permease protein
VDVRAVDTSATTGHSGLHGASPVSKLVAFALVLTSVVVQNNVLVVASIALLLVALVLGSRLPARQMFALAVYPAVFATIFAFAAAPDLLTGVLFVLKAMTAALGAIVLVFTTPYPQLFAPVQSVTPSVVGDAMLMTYRSIFLLGEKFSHLQRAVRLRSGLSHGHPVLAARATATSLGGLLLYAFDLSQREYDVMRLRGYEGRLKISRARAAKPAFDAAVVAAAALALAVAVLWRLGAAALEPYSWLPVVGALLMLGGALVWRWTRR